MFRKNVAGQFIHVQGVDASTGGIKSGVTWTVRRCIDGTFAAATGTATEDGTTGWYKFALSQADTNGNDIGFNFTGTGAVPQTINIVTTAADPTDAADFGLTNLDAAISSRMATYTQPTGFLAATFPSGTVANTTNITAGTVTTATNLTNLPTIPANWLTAAGTAADFTAEIQSGLATAAALSTVQADTDDIQSRLPAALVSGRIDASVGAIAANAITAASMAADVATEIRSVASGTSDSGSTTTMVDAARTEGDTDYWKGNFILFTSGTVLGQCRLITAFDAATDTITFTPATTAAVSTQTYEILPAARVDLGLWLGSVANALVSGRVDSSTGAMDAGVITALAVAADAGNEIADALLDRANAIETGLTLRQAHRLEAASASGKLSGAATTTVTIRNAAADTKARITATVDSDGNRTAITTDVT